MAKLFFGMNVSLDGYVDHQNGDFIPDPVLFAHFIRQTQGLTGSLYGRRLYEIMSYWDGEQAHWDAADWAFAHAWRANPKWVVSRTLTSVGDNATLLDGDLEAEVRRLKDEHEGEIEVGGPVLAKSLGDLGLIDEYRLHIHPVVLGGGAPMFIGPRPRLRLISNETISGVVKLTYVPD